LCSAIYLTGVHFFESWERPAGKVKPQISKMVGLHRNFSDIIFLSFLYTKQQQKFIQSTKNVMMSQET